MDKKSEEYLRQSERKKGCIEKQILREMIIQKGA